MPAKESKAPAKAAAKVAKAAAPAKAASKGAKKGGKNALKGTKKTIKARKPVRVGAKGIKGYKGNLKAKSLVKESIKRLSLRKKAKKMIARNPNAKHSKAYKELKKQSVSLKVRLNKVPTRSDAARARSKVMSRVQGWKNGQAPHKTIRKGRLHSWREGNPLFINRPRNLGIGNALQPKRDLKRFVKWPKYIRIQRQKRILLERLKVPPMVNQFRKATRRNHALTLFRFLRQYKPEESGARRKRLLKAARAKAAGKDTKKDPKYKRPITVTTGLQHTTRMILNKTAKLVLIAADVDPIEIVIALPTLCRKMDVPYLIVKGKARMGALVGMKTCTTIAIPKLKPEHDKQLSNFVNIARKRFNDNVEVRKQWGGLKLGPKSRQRIEKQRRLVKTEARIRRRADAEKKKARAGL